jgi:hypothetical protein
VRRNFRFNLKRGDIFTAATVSVLHTVNEIKRAFSVFPESIAGMKPAIAPSCSCRFRVLEIAAVEGPRRIAPYN